MVTGKDSAYQVVDLRTDSFADLAVRGGLKHPGIHQQRHGFGQGRQSFQAPNRHYDQCR